MIGTKKEVNMNKKNQFDYANDSDQELYLHSKIAIDKRNIQVTAGTLASSVDKLNEDAFAITYDEKNLIAAIFDGTTSLKPIKSLGAQTGARFASHFLKNTLHQINTNQSPRELLLQLNKNLLEKSLQFEGATMHDTHTLPSSTATIIKINFEKNIVTFAHVADSLGIVYLKNDISKIFTKDTNNKFDTEMFSLIAKIAKEKNISPREARQDEGFKQALVDMFIKRNNNPDGSGSGVVNGDPEVEQYIQNGSVPLDDITHILLATDGLIPVGWSEQKEQDRQKLLTEIQSGGFQKIVTIKKQNEDADPDWNHIRYKHSDDATGILITI